MDLSKLKSKTASIDKLVQAAQEVSGGNQKSGEDTRFWKPTVDKAGNGYAVIRFLPSPDDDGMEWARYWDHGFKGPTGKWYIEKSLTSIGQKDPLAELNSRLWATEDPDNQKLVRERKRRLHYVTNILVVSDPSNPDNEGKVFLYNFGKKIFDKVMDLMQPQFPDEDPVNPFDLWQGADFVLKIRKVEGYRNYDKSEFKSPSALYEGDENRLQAVADNLYSLREFTDPSNYKTYEQLQTKLMEVLGESMPRTVKQEAAVQTTAPAPEPKAAPAPQFASTAADDDDDGGETEDDTLSFFQNLVDED